MRNNRRAHIGSMPRLCGRAGGWRRWMVGIVGLMILMVQVGAWAGIDQAKPGQSGAAAMSGAMPGAAGADPHAGMFSGAGSAAMPGPGMTASGARMSDAMMQQKMLQEFYAKQNRSAFEAGIQLDAFRVLAIHHLDQMKIIDSWARQSISKIRNRQTLDGKDPVYTAMDMALRPEVYVDRNIIYVQAVPVREQLTLFAAGANEVEKRAEQDRIMHEGLVSPNFLLQPQVQQMLEMMSRDTTKMQAANKVFDSLVTFMKLGTSLTFLPPPAGPAWDMHDAWVNPVNVSLPEEAAIAPAVAAGATTAPAAGAMAGPVSPYDAETTRKIVLAFKQLAVGWQENDVALANSGVGGFVAVAGAIDPEHYPSATKRTVELWYNRSFNGTIIAFVYFLAMTLFLMVAVGVTKKAGRVEKVALGVFGTALALHVAVSLVRWWLAGRIPIQNQFESVLGAACLGCIVGVALETWKRNGVFGVAFSFVGFLAMTICLASPYVFGEPMRGESIEKVAGILTNTAWLYIHVNIVIASYALIFASAVIGAIYLGIKLWHWINPIEPGNEETQNSKLETQNDGGRLSSGGTLTMQLDTASVAEIEKTRGATLETLDQANMVVLQMAFWLLGTGVICGAVWADRSWGRPWGWDPKETFALVTWIVYLIIVHVRFVTPAKATWSAGLAVVGCGVMLFNWIGVNFFLQGLHSYA